MIYEFMLLVFVVFLMFLVRILIRKIMWGISKLFVFIKFFIYYLNNVKNLDKFIKI